MIRNEIIRVVNKNGKFMRDVEEPEVVFYSPASRVEAL